MENLKVTLRVSTSQYVADLAKMIRNQCYDAETYAKILKIFILELDCHDTFCELIRTWQKEIEANELI